MADVRLERVWKVYGGVVEAVREPVVETSAMAKNPPRIEPRNHPA